MLLEYMYLRWSSGADDFFNLFTIYQGCTECLPLNYCFTSRWIVHPQQNSRLFKRKLECMSKLCPSIRIQTREAIRTWDLEFAAELRSQLVQNIPRHNLMVLLLNERALCGISVGKNIDQSSSVTSKAWEFPKEEHYFSHIMVASNTSNLLLEGSGKEIACFLRGSHIT